MDLGDVLAEMAPGDGVSIGPGDYTLTEPLVLPVGSSLELQPGAVITAAAAMDAMVKTSAEWTRSNSVFGGGRLDCAGLADVGIWPRGFAYFGVSDIRIDSPKVAGIKLGDSTLQRSAEAIISRVHVYRPSGQAMPAGSWGIISENSGDHSLSQVIVQSQESGIKMDGTGSVLTDCHVWHDPTCGSMLTCFDDAGFNDYIGCAADTPMVSGWRLRGTNSRIIGGKVYLNPNYANDNVVIGLDFDSAAPFSSVFGMQFLGGSASKRMAKDIDLADFTTLKVAGCWSTNVALAYASTDRALTVRARDIVVAPRTLPTASANFRGQIAYVNGATDVADVAYICRKNAANGYEWVALT